MKNDLNFLTLCTLSGIVIHGRGIGKLMGMPTANLDCTAEKLPSLGVYVSLVCWDDAEFMGVTHIGTRPTIDNDDAISIETHLLSFDGNLYGQRLEILLLHKLRDSMKFPSASHLKEQFHIDCCNAKSYFSNVGAPVANEAAQILAAGELRIYPEQRTVLLGKEAIPLTPKEFDVLVLLISNQNTVLSKEQIYETVWKQKFNGYCHQVETVVSQLHKKLNEKTGLFGRIKTITGFGYQYEC